MRDYVNSTALQEYTTKLVAKLKTLFPGTPTAAATVADMTDHSKTYVYVGSETGYTAGDWYYWNGTAWTSGGPFQATSIITDTTLAVAGEAADAKATGDAIAAAKAAVLNAMAPAYSTSATYAVGDYVNYNGSIYRCTTAITTAESWTSGHWTAVVLGADLASQVSDLKTQLENAFGLAYSNKRHITGESDDPYKAIDTLFTTGNYTVSSAAIAAALAADGQTPPRTDTGFALFVMQVSMTNRWAQIAIMNRSSTKYNDLIYIRTSLNGTSYGSWKNLATRAEITDLSNSLQNRCFSLNVSDSTAINSGDDLNGNAYIVPGNYHSTSSTITNSLTNCPVREMGFKLIVFHSSANNRYYQLLIGNTSVPTMWIRPNNGSWYDWGKIDIDLKPAALTSFGVSIIANNYTTYFPNGSYNDAPINSIIYIGQNVPLADGPDGDDWIGYRSHYTTGYIRGTLITARPKKADDTVYGGLVQMLIGYRETDYKPTFSYRIAIQNSGAYVWSAWSKFEENGYLHSGNRVISAGRMSESVSDLDNMPANCIYQIDRNCTGETAESTLGHHPAPGVSCIVSTIAFSYSTNHGMVQTVYALDGRMFWRYGYQQSSTEYRYTAWNTINKNVPAIPAPPTTDGTYILRATVSGGAATFAWVSN